jgi:hypothetical protein
MSTTATWGGKEDLSIRDDSIADPLGQGPRTWFQRMPEGKTIENRLHLDVSVDGDRSVPLEIRAERVDAEARRLAGFGATVVADLAEPGLNHYAVAMLDPRANSSTSREALTAVPVLCARPTRGRR